ncbi:hypothetical protein IJ11_0005210 [Lacticaseibacillus paracasei]|nr:hypothetical protein IJ11_0005210 [Lacticaseibacillus paracasei]
MISPFKRVLSRRNLHIRTTSAMAKVRPSHLCPLMLRFLTAADHALTRILTLFRVAISII